VKPERVEIFNFREEESKTKFHIMTSETDEFTHCFENENPLLNQIERWEQVLKMYCCQSFKKIRIRKKNSKPLKQPLKMLIDKRNKLLKEINNVDSNTELEEITKRISEIEAEDNRDKIMKNFKEYSDNPEYINVQKMWKMLKRMWPKGGASLPVAKELLRKDCYWTQRYKKSVGD
jgi:hypothetical protein